MKKERSTRDQVRELLRSVGFGLIQFDSPLQADSKLRIDVLAWAADSTGELVPWAVVELKRGQFKTPELTLPSLARSRDLLGTVDHYAVVNGQWFKADRGVRSLEPVNGPTPPPYGTGGFLADEEIATSLLVKRLWREADLERSRGVRADFFFPSAELLAETAVPGIEGGGGEFVPVRADVLWRARRRALLQFSANSRAGSDLTSHPVIATAVAALTGSRLAGTVLDPFCGTGSFLWAAMDLALAHEEPVEFVGIDINERLADLAAMIGRTAPLMTTITHGDAFRESLPQADVVLAAPPVGMHLQEPRKLIDGTSTNDATVAGVDLAVRQLRPGGRAIVHVGAGFTFQQSAESFRQYLAHGFRVAAVLGLPSGAVPGTGVRSALLVIDKAEPGDTFVAQLGGDWETQLKPGGAALTAALDHIDADPAAG